MPAAHFLTSVLPATPSFHKKKLPEAQFFPSKDLVLGPFAGLLPT